MGFDIHKPLGIGGIKSNIKVAPNKIAFGSRPGVDYFQSTSVEKYMTEDAIKSAIASNPEIKQILKEIGAPQKLNLEELKDLTENHAKDTQNIAVGIIQNLPLGLKEHVNIKSVKDAAYLHDIGKVLIPPEVLNKKGKLTDEEQQIMHRHSELGYELLKNTDIDTRTLHLVKYHHQNMSHKGYPKVKDDFFADINLQILSTADKFSALTEKRVYKDPMAKEMALAYLYKDVYNGNLHPFIYKALVDYANGA